MAKVYAQLDLEAGFAFQDGQGYSHHVAAMFGFFVGNVFV